MSRVSFKTDCAFLLLLAFALSVAGCGSGLVGAVKKDAAGVSGGGASLNIVIGQCDFGDAGPVRTIAPAHIPTTQLLDPARYRISIEGTHESGSTLPTTPLTFTGGRATLPNLAAGVWVFTLSAQPLGQPSTQFVGRKAVQVKEINDEPVIIPLFPVETGTGTVSVTVTWQTSDRDACFSPAPARTAVEFALYDMVTGAMVGNPARFTKQPNSFNNPNPTFTWAFNNYQFPVGEYEARFTLTSSVIPGGIYVYSDNLYVEPGRQTTGTIVIPKIVNIPAGAGTLTETCTTPVNSVYDGTLRWNGGSIYNNEGYQLQVLATSHATVPTNDTVWSTAAGQAGAVLYDYDSSTLTRQGQILYKSGGLEQNDTNITFKMRVINNVKYYARIRCSNYWGYSPWSYCTTVIAP